MVLQKVALALSSASLSRAITIRALAGVHADNSLGWEAAGCCLGPRSRTHTAACRAPGDSCVLMQPPRSFRCHPFSRRRLPTRNPLPILYLLVKQQKIILAAAKNTLFTDVENISL